MNFHNSQIPNELKKISYNSHFLKNKKKTFIIAKFLTQLHKVKKSTPTQKKEESKNVKQIMICGLTWPDQCLWVGYELTHFCSRVQNSYVSKNSSFSPPSFSTILVFSSSFFSPLFNLFHLISFLFLQISLALIYFISQQEMTMKLKAMKCLVTILKQKRLGV